MKRWKNLLALAALIWALFLSSCAHCPKSGTWKKGDHIVCPNCGEEFTLPEKLGK